jgi:hypothetical protein
VTAFHCREDAAGRAGGGIACSRRNEDPEVEEDRAREIDVQREIGNVYLPMSKLRVVGEAKNDGSGAGMKCAPVGGEIAK